MANAGSCKIGFKPKPSLGVGDKELNGFELNKIKKRKYRKNDHPKQ